MRSRVLALAAPLATLLLATLLAAGCGAGETADAAKGAARPQIAVVPKGTSHEFWKSIHAGAVKAGRELGAEIEWKGPLREDDRPGQIRVLEDFIVRGVDGIVVAPLDDKALAPVLAEAAGRGIPVVVVDSDVAWDGRVSFVATDNRLGGVLAARRLGALLGGRGRVLLMRYQEGSASTAKREAGFLETLAAELPEVEVVSESQYAGATAEGAYRTAENLLVAHPELDGVFCPNESTAFGMLRALQDTGRAGSVKLVGFDPSEKMLAALRAGEMHGIVVQDPFAMGETGVATLLAHRAGEAVAARIETRVVLVTAENLDEPDVAALVAPDLARWLGE